MKFDFTGMPQTPIHEFFLEELEHVELRHVFRTLYA